MSSHLGERFKKNKKIRIKDKNFALLKQNFGSSVEEIFPNLSENQCQPRLSGMREFVRGPDSTTNRS
jgi:hypothetical protein